MGMAWEQSPYLFPRTASNAAWLTILQADETFMQAVQQRTSRSYSLVVILRVLVLVTAFSSALMGLTQTMLLPAPLRLPNPALPINASASRADRWRSDLDYFASQTARLH